MKSHERWQLVVERNPLAYGQFVYAVRTTGIYCRPTCPSRRPHPEHVEFFETPQDAESAGFRPCLRCQPSQLPPQTEAAKEICRYLAAHVDRKVTLDELTGACGLSAFHLQRVFKQQTGITPRRYQEYLRQRLARGNLRDSASVTESIYNAGYSSSSRFYESAAKQLGMPPSAWRKGGEGVRILYSILASPLGLALVAATAKGVCFLAIGDSAEKLEASLRLELPRAVIERDDLSLAEHKQAILDYFAGAMPHPDLPLDIRATAFQAKVWSILQSIRPGQTRTYSDIALELGDIHLTRAVARACATNPVSVAIPCHRVVRADGTLAGYRWGLHRKQKLLALESRAPRHD